jgi:hypothetical protein
MDSDSGDPKGSGCPIRRSADQRVLAPPRGFSQRATSFIASQCQGIHQMPFFALEPKPNPSRANPRTRHPFKGTTVEDHAESAQLRQLSTSSLRSARRAISDNASKHGRADRRPPHPRCRSLPHIRSHQASSAKRSSDPSCKASSRPGKTRPRTDRSSYPQCQTTTQLATRRLRMRTSADIRNPTNAGRTLISRRILSGPRRLEPPRQPSSRSASGRLSGPRILPPDSVQTSPPAARQPRRLGLGSIAPTSAALVELTGIEPVTPCLQSRCSPS